MQYIRFYCDKCTPENENKFDSCIFSSDTSNNRHFRIIEQLRPILTSNYKTSIKINLACTLGFDHVQLCRASIESIISTENYLKMSYFLEDKKYFYDVLNFKYLKEFGIVSPDPYNCNGYKKNYRIDFLDIQSYCSEEQALQIIKKGTMIEAMNIRSYKNLIEKISNELNSRSMYLKKSKLHCYGTIYYIVDSYTFTKAAIK
jgi:hypothetical protein